VAYVIFYCCFAYSHFEGGLKGFGFGHAEMPLPCCKIHSHDTHVRRRVMWRGGECKGRKEREVKRETAATASSSSSFSVGHNVKQNCTQQTHKHGKPKKKEK